MVEGTLLRRWVLRFTLGELVGFGLLPALGGTLVAAWTNGMSATPRALLLYAVAVGAGFGEGAVLGAFQRPVVQALFPSVSGRRWVLATGLAASVAWAAGMLAPTLDDVVGLSTGAMVGIWAAAGVVILSSIGTAQAWVLRGHTSRARSWIVANAVGWLCGLPWTFALPALLPDDAPPVAFGGVFAVAGVLMGATTGWVTGRWLQRLAAPQP